MAYFFSILNILLLVTLLSRAIFRGYLTFYPLFFLYIGYCLVTAVVQLITLLIGFELMSSPQFRAVYNYTNLPIPFLQLAILSWITTLVDNGRFWRRMFAGLILVALVSGPVLWVFSEMRLGFFFQFHSSFAVIQVVVCILVFQVLIHHKEVDVGRNVKGILYGMSLISLVQFYNFLSLFIGTLEYGLFQILWPTCYSLAFSIFIYSLWEYDGVKEVPSGRVYAKVHTRLRDLVRSTVMLLFR